MTHDPTSTVWEEAAGKPLDMVDCFICKKTFSLNDAKWLMSKPSDAWLRHATCEGCFSRVWKG